MNSNSKGDHILTVKINIPNSLTAEQKALFECIKNISK
jgi:hypothetical protein